MKTVPAAWAKARGSSRSYKIKSKSSRLPPLLQGLREARLWLLLLILTSGALRSGGADGQDPTGAPHMDVRRFPRGQDAPSENPAGSEKPVRSTGGEGGVCFFAPGFFAHARSEERRGGKECVSTSSYLWAQDY